MVNIFVSESSSILTHVWPSHPSDKAMLTLKVELSSQNLSLRILLVHAYFKRFAFFHTLPLHTLLLQAHSSLTWA